MRFTLPLLIVLFSCATSENPSYDIQEFYEKETREDFWICYHPGTEFHNKECVEEEFPLGCYVSGDRGKFCWVLSSSECSEKSRKKSVEEACVNLGYDARN